MGDVECKEAVRSSITAPTFLIQTKYNDSYALLGELASCGSTDKQTCLKTVVLLTDNKKNVSASTLPSPVFLGPACRPSQLYAPLTFLAGGGLQIRWQCVAQ